MYKIPATTLFIGKNLIFVPECPSTNTLAQQLGQQSSTPDGSLVITDNQTAGRGQRGNSWQTSQGMNFTFSILLKPSFLTPNQQFYLNVAVSLGIFHYLKQKTQQAVAIKWPNDILIQQKKICGVLIENSIQGSRIQNAVVGVGLNINQQSFESEKATSLRNITGVNYVLDDELNVLLAEIEKKYLALRQGHSSELVGEYCSFLFGMNEERQFRAHDVDFSGIIVGIDSIGRLRMNTSSGERSFGLKEVEFLY